MLLQITWNLEKMQFPVTTFPFLDCNDQALKLGYTTGFLSSFSKCGHWLAMGTDRYLL